MDSYRQPMSVLSESFPCIRMSGPRRRATSWALVSSSANKPIFVESERERISLGAKLANHFSWILGNGSLLRHFWHAA